MIELPYDNNFGNTAPDIAQTVTKNGVTFKPNNDGSISIWGSATAITVYSLRNYYGSATNTSRFKLGAGTYTIGLYSDDTQVSNGSVRLVTNKYSASAIYLGHPATFTITDE